LDFGHSPLISYHLHLNTVNYGRADCLKTKTKGKFILLNKKAVKMKLNEKYNEDRLTTINNSFIFSKLYMLDKATILL